MGKIVFVELLDRRGHVRERFRLETFPASIGRAYSNTVIIDDRLACPEHLRVYLDEQRAMIVEDLASVNGMCLAFSPQRLSRHIIPPVKDAEIRVGNTLQRFRGEDYIVGPAEALRDLESIRDHIALDSPHYAELVVSRIIASVGRLEAFPDSGRMVPERGDPEIREVIVRPYRVVYRRRASEVEIATVFRATRLLPEIG